MNELQKLIDELDRPELTEARWREMTARAGDIVDELQIFEAIEPFLQAGAVRGWELDS